MNLHNVPQDIQKSQQFCFWKSIPNSNPTQKAIKKPYGFCQKTQKLIPSLKNSNFWLDWEKALNLIPNLSKEWGLGLVLNGGPYVVIDLDNCISGNEDPNFLEPVITLLNMFKGSYIEISPSGRGLHIIFRGEWPYKQNKGNRPLDPISNSGTIEIYSGKDCRFITLTGLAFSPHKTHHQRLPSNFLNEMRFLYFKYLEKDLVNSNLLPITFSSNCSQTLAESANPNLINENFQKDILSIKQKIQASNQTETYQYLCEANPGDYKSISEADWQFCLFVLNFFSEEQLKNPGILKQLLISERPYRNKLDRQDYINRTICNAILKAQKDNLIGHPDKKTKNPSIKTVSKKHIIKLCNIMHIFHLGQNKILQNASQIISNNPNNYLIVTMSQTLNSKDYDYYIQIMEQSTQKIRDNNLTIESLPNKHLAVEISIKQVLDNLQLKSSGQAYKNFINSLRKLSQVTILQRKKINDNGKLSEYSGNLLSYKYCTSTKSKYKKLIVYLNLLTVEILLQGKCNYSLFNFQSYRSLEDHRLRLLYYNLCLKTVPGGSNVYLTTDELLQILWQKSIDRTTIQSRKKVLISLLENLNKNKHKLNDLKINLKKSGKQIMGIFVGKIKLNLK